MSINLEKSLKNRKILVNNVTEEIIGPSQINGNYEELDLSSGMIELPDDKSFYKVPYYYKNGDVKEEILSNMSPRDRYVAGQLFPIDVDKPAVESETTEFFDLVLERDNIDIDSDDKKEIDVEDSTEDLGDIELLPQKSDFLPSTIGLTFCVDKDVNELEINISGGNYRTIIARTADEKRQREWWYRVPVSETITFKVEELIKNHQTIITEVLKDKQHNLSPIEMGIQVLSREVSGKYIITVSATNRSKGSEDEQKLTLYQSKLSIRIPNGGCFSPYPRQYQLNKGLSKEDMENELLYRNEKVYALGHGCSSDWTQDKIHINEISTTFIPKYEAHSMTPNISINVNGVEVPLVFKMSDLAGLSSSKSPKEILKPLIDGYEEWISKKYEEVYELDEELIDVGKSNMAKCNYSLQRIREGLDLLDDPKVLKAFRLANAAILIQQSNGKRKRNGWIDENDSIVYDSEYIDNVKLYSDLKNCSNSWRPFQIAFFLMSLKSIVQEDSDDREIVDLIWFPTGGGKTEAYLGVSAFLMIYKRILNPNDIGVNIIMRYTLRLLTADQFQRAARLICALEYIRKDNVYLLGGEPYSIGIWVGAQTTPNSNENAEKELRSLVRNDRDGKEFILHSCPWCGSKLGYFENQTGAGKKKKDKFGRSYLGYKFDKVEKRLLTYCPDKNCEFHSELPVYIVDNTIYSKRPTFLIGTIDKFVQLVWNPNARSLFGIGEEGERIASPPSLIIQDELHLISGPLGTLSGLFEILVESLCTKQVEEKKWVKPKIIAATATIKHFNEQALALFGRENAKLFPPSGLDSEDSFFSRPALSEEGSFLPGRLYVGINTSNVKVSMAQVMTFSSILQATALMEEDSRDPYWTLLSFYNTLRDLSSGLTLAQMNIPTYSDSMMRRKGMKKDQRYLKSFLELTSRKQSHEISGILDDLKRSYVPEDRYPAIDLCLTSNIIEVGVDIDRLSVMAIVGQPKMTSQYIQVSGRVGRKWSERPGVIFTIYSNTKSRDKSHYENFREYHQKLYGQVEPTSVTPFSDASLDRGLFAIVVAYLRQNFDSGLANGLDRDLFMRRLDPLKEFCKDIIRKCDKVDPEQKAEVGMRIERIVRILSNPEFTSWSGENGLLYKIGAVDHLPGQIPMINSLRSVDAQSLGQIINISADSTRDSKLESFMEGLF